MTRTDQLIALGVIVLMGALIGGAVWLWPAPITDETPATLSHDQLVTEESAMTGSISAKVTLVEWGDFQCPACASVAPIVEELIAKYGTNPDFNFVFRHFPLPQHQNAKIASEAAIAAGAQNKFWEMYALLYKQQREWSLVSDPRTLFATYASTLGLDKTAFDTALEKHTFADFVDADKQTGTTLGLSHTPTLYLNGIEQTSVSLVALTKAIDDALAK